MIFKKLSLEFITFNQEEVPEIKAQLIKSYS